MKYVITDNYRVAMVDSRGFHADLSEAIDGLVTGAGHMRIENGRVKVFGVSHGYRIAAKEEDVVILEQALGIIV